MLRQRKNMIILTMLLIYLSSCYENANKDTEKLNSNILQSQKINTQNWLDQFDLDGDGIKDHIYFDFSGGAHCCYKINIVLTSDKKERTFPFEMDGGYIGGIDNSKPDQFDIRDIDNDRLPEILMRIQTYNGGSKAIPVKWQTEYGIKSNHIVIEYKGEQLTIRDYKQ